MLRCCCCCLFRIKENKRFCLFVWINRIRLFLVTNQMLYYLCIVFDYISRVFYSISRVLTKSSYWVSLESFRIFCWRLLQIEQWEGEESFAQFLLSARDLALTILLCHLI